MTPTRSVNERVAEVVGFKCPVHEIAAYDTNCSIPPYETSLDAAMLAYEVMRSRGWKAQCGESSDDCWYVILERIGKVPVYRRGLTLSLAFCAAILAAAEKESR